ncbi:MAG: hypothetical protein JXR10_04755 [Cyclobacteriaceae bacterium]
MKILSTVVYFASIFITLMAIVLMLVNNEIGHVPGWLKMFVLSIIFVVGVLLFFIIIKDGIRSEE